MNWGILAAVAFSMMVWALIVWGVWSVIHDFL